MRVQRGQARAWREVLEVAARVAGLLAMESEALGNREGAKAWWRRYSRAAVRRDREADRAMEEAEAEREADEGAREDADEERREWLRGLEP